MANPSVDGGLLVSFIVLLGLIICSGLISGSEVAFFSLGPTDFKSIQEQDSSSGSILLSLKEIPEKLLATILIANNFVNIAIVIVSQLIFERLLGEGTLQQIGESLSTFWPLSAFSPAQLAQGFNIAITVVLVTSILVLFGEISPKIYANLNARKFALLMARPLQLLTWAFTPLSMLLVFFGARLESRLDIQKNNNTNSSKEDLDAAIAITVEDSAESHQEAGILRGIVKFGDLSAKQVMKPRVDVVAVEVDSTYNELLKLVRDSGYSRIPVYREDLDSIEGILYVKDLLGHTEEAADFQWQTLIRDTVLYIPEYKKIDDLLREFQLKRMHMAIVVNEYGGTMGIVTLEDIMEEVIGEIMDEFDEDEDVEYIKLGDNNYIFEGKTLLNDVCRVIGERTGYFDEMKGNSDSLGGLIIENLGHIPKAEKELMIKNVQLKVITVTNRRIEKVNLRVIPTHQIA